MFPSRFKGPCLIFCLTHQDACFIPQRTCIQKLFDLLEIARRSIFFIDIVCKLQQAAKRLLFFGGSDDCGVANL